MNILDEIRSLIKKYADLEAERNQLKLENDYLRARLAKIVKEAGQ